LTYGATSSDGTGREMDRPQSAKATGPSHSIRAAMTRLYLLLKKKMSGQERTTRIHSRNPSAPG
jgi:hypothetical protein